MNLKAFISEVNTWSDFKTVLETKTKLEKGKAFEKLIKYYLEYNPIYKSKLKKVWLQSEITPSILKKLNLPSNDQGIDLIAETVEGKFWAIQCKYLQEEKQRLSHRAISTFVSLSTGIAQNITYCLVCTTVDEYAKIYHGKTNIGFCTSDDWRKLDKTFFDWLRAKLGGKEKKLIPYKPKPHQMKALSEAKNYFIKDNNSRGKLVFPCGAGKSLTGYWITRELKSKSIIIAVPSLSLVKQTLEVYLRESVANNEKISWLCVCSDEGIGKNDDVAIHTNELGVPCVTDKNFIANWLIANSKNKTIIFTTYQSGKTIAEASKISKHSFNLGIMDEAHKTVGDKDKLFSHLLFEQNISVEKRIFMTATERRYAGSSDTVLSMNDESVYGETFAQMSFKEAIEIDILSDYKIITLFISNDKVKKLIQQNAFIKPKGKDWDEETEARTLASLIALRKAMTDYPIHHAVTFHSSIKKAEAFEQSQSVFSKAYPKFAKVKSYHVSGAMPTSVRGKIVDEFASTEKAIITNAKCLTEGIDVPNIDCVLFADPRKSAVDIVQTVGRALRKKEGKQFGYVILPVFTDSTETEEIIDSDEFKEILITIRALASNDERIIEYFRDISKGKIGNKKDSLIQFDIDEQIASKINEKELIESIQIKTWNKLAKLSWMSFEEARNYVCGLNLKNQNEWFLFCKSGKKPSNIPVNPQSVYFKNGWRGFGYWLGTGTISNNARIYLDFDSARKHIQSLNLKTSEDYKKWHRINKRLDLPNKPDRFYKDSGFLSWPDWLGTKHGYNGEYYSYNNAKEYLKSYNFKDEKQFKLFCKSTSKPAFIPSNPRKAYINSGWLSIGDFLSYKIGFKTNVYLGFKAARKIVRSKKIESRNEWIAFTKNDFFWNNIPKEPHLYYAKDGFINYKDWLGTDRLGHKDRVYRNFQEARKFIRTLNLKNQNEWNEYCKSGRKPNDIPSNPDKKYKKNWINLADWIGSNTIATNLRFYKSFEEAKTFAQKNKIKSQVEWYKLYEQGKIPDDFPKIVYHTYKIEWKGWAYFLGYDKEK